MSILSLQYLASKDNNDYLVHMQIKPIMPDSSVHHNYSELPSLFKATY